MKGVSRVMAWIGVLAVVDVVWLHAEAYGVELAQFGLVKRIFWGLAVPWFFCSSLFWLAVRWRGFKIEMTKRMRTLVVPYFCWCVLGSVWSIALHGVQLHGWEAIRYLGLHPWLDPAYQPMWFIRNLFFVLLVGAAVLHVLYKRIQAPVLQCRISPPAAVSIVFPVYVLHSMWLSVARQLTGKMRFGGVEAVFVVAGAVGLSIGCWWIIQRFMPKVATVLFGGRISEQLKENVNETER